ncbi:malonyl-ACP O-methyltransferase BioC [Acinetobacter indicus]|uniref:Malonyl-[acyl-carrier protein] O-methyltransferase n=1 Tax=Acinetobacter indicus CIP 110367 TaxID=1341679 RepID=V2UGD7_9GAMM|nr:malonyl-ACP O-methyltransferase BioC [Acinetobacter indicus]EPF70550.1 biotin biosynthesis protein BioC [Acinetobacter indicus ANC 4215]ESK49262.1 biotin biosynthesis protein BioC [Acinetobacter indicus CIP 110367]
MRGAVMMDKSAMSVNKSQVARRFAQAHHSYLQHAVIQQQICQQLVRLMQSHLTSRKLGRVFEIGCGTGALTRALEQHFQVQQLLLNDLYPEVQQQLFSTSRTEWWIGDAEQIAFPEQLDMLISSSALQWMQNLQQLFAKIAHALKPSGYLCFSSFGPDNLKEIKALTGQGLDYFSLPELRRCLESQGFEIVYLSETVKTLAFEHPRQVLQHLKATGVTGTASGHRWTKHSLQQFYQAYRQFSRLNVAGQQEYLLSYHPIYCIARSTG